MKSFFLLIFVLSLGIEDLFSQHLSSAEGKSSLGLGIGLPYGGFGTQISYNTANNVNAFLGLGYNLTGIGVNGGLKLIVPSKKDYEFYFTGMYGYNAVIVMKGAKEMNGAFGGPSFGSGLKINSLVQSGVFWDIGFLVPLRSSSYKDRLEEIEQNPYMHVNSKPWPVLFYLAYHFPLSKY
ncbi:hypothetical protein [Cyclobacterium sp.]|uniref:hypothetical protein n=1 Tax=Cyclobacterium sp. TaxID=1966343 RepID=UPI0019A8BBCF|nr:hypothetical protein [Cyclobacterium sp.]MBD3627906.1 hypothetical protein [Cyclobacterium sp.]